MDKRTQVISRAAVHLIILLLCLIFAQNQANASHPGAAADNELLIRFKDGADLRIDHSSMLMVNDLELKILNYFPGNNLFLARTPDPADARRALSRVRSLENVEFVEPNYTRKIQSVVPNDPLFSSQWSLPKIQAGKAWEHSIGSSRVVVAVADSGIDYLHEDLAANIWRNPGEICDNGIDDNGDGYVDNCYGINTINNSGDPMDDQGHGTFVSGIIGAVGNNAKGISGVNWDVSLMALKFMGPDGTGRVSDLIQAIEFAVDKNVRIFNMSFGSYNFSRFEKEAMENASDILFIAAAGNEALNNNISPLYPASYDLPNIISVAASNQSDNLVAFSNYGSRSVSLAAPGMSIVSTRLDDSYGSFSGTSAAASVVSGAAALVLSANADLTVDRLRDRILMNVDALPGLEGKVLTGGRLNIYKSLTGTLDGPQIFNAHPQRVRPGSEVTLRGAGFLKDQGSVLIGGVEASVESWSNHKIVCIVPQAGETGHVRVITSAGVSSNILELDIQYVSGTYGYYYPHASTRSGENYFLKLLNIYDRPVEIYSRSVSASGIEKQKTLFLDPFERRFIHLGYLEIINDDLMLLLESEDFFGAYMLQFCREGKRIYPVYSRNHLHDYPFDLPEHWRH